MALCFGPCNAWEKVQCHCSTSSLVRMGRTFLEAVSLANKNSLGGIPPMMVPCARLYPNGSLQYDGRVLNDLHKVKERREQG